MVILNLKMNNILAFNDFEVNFSYPKKLNKTLIPNENLNNKPSFRYKKLNIFIGSNATGKTSLIKCIWTILLFLNRREQNIIEEIINQNGKPASIELDYADEEENKSYLKRIIIKYDNNELKMGYNYLSIRDNDSYESRSKDFEGMTFSLLKPIDCFQTMNISSGWNIVLPATEKGFDTVKFADIQNDEEEKEYFNILNQVLKTLDSSIINVTKSMDAPNAIVIKHENANTIIIQAGYSISSINYLSSGTKYGINLANILFSIKYHKNGIYLIDEQFSYVNSDVEASILSTMVSMLGPNEQLFFTTHNSNILELGFPFHSFNFMKKVNVGGKQKIEVSCATEVENRNNVSPKSILDNDMLGTAPNVNRIFEIGEVND